MNWNDVLRRVNKIVKADNVNSFFALIVVLSFFLGVAFAFSGGPMTIVGIALIVMIVIWAINRATKHSKNLRDARKYAAEQLLFPHMRENFRIFEADPGREIPEFMLQKSGLIKNMQRYKGYGYTRAEYRGIVFMCCNFEEGKRRKNSNDEDDIIERSRAMSYGRYEYSRYIRGVYKDAMFVRADLKQRLNGFLRIETVNSNPNLFGRMLAGMETLTRKAGGARVYDFSSMNAEFQKHFRVSATDETLTRQVLTQRLMDGLLKTIPYTSGRLTILFKEDELFIMHEHGHALLCIENGKYTMEQLQEDARNAESEVFTVRAILDTFADCATGVFF